MADTLFEWKLEAQGLHPDTLPAHVLCEIVLNIEKSLLAVAQEQYPNIKPEDIVVALNEVGDGSARLRFASANVLVIATAATILATAIHTRTFNALPKAAQESLDKIVHVTKRNNYNSELRLKG